MKTARLLCSGMAAIGIAVNPVDGSIWGSVLSFPGAVVRHR